MAEPISEHDLVVSLVETIAQPTGEHGPLRVDAGTTGAVVAVHREGSLVAAYEVEFYLGGDVWGLATLSIGAVERPSTGNVYRAIVCRSVSDSTSLRIAVCAKDLNEAQQKLEARYGVGTVFDLHNQEDADHPR